MSFVCYCKVVLFVRSVVRYFFSFISYALRSLFRTLVIPCVSLASVSFVSSLLRDLGISLCVPFFMYVCRSSCLSFLRSLFM